MIKKSHSRNWKRMGLTAAIIGSMGCSHGQERKNIGGEILLKILGTIADKDRPEWDQKKAEEMLDEILEMEDKKDFRWRRIDWEIDPREVIARSQKEKKPILTYLFLKREVGPREAPC